MASTVAYIKPEVLRWARESIGYSLEQAAAKIRMPADKLERAERDSEELHLTLRQAERAAKAYERKLSDLFRPEPPTEAPLEAQFRRLPGAPPLPWPPEMRALSRRIRDRQEAAVELLDLVGEEPTWPTVEVPTARNPAAAADSMRKLLGISLKEQRSWRDRAGYTPLREWIDAVESLGVLVMQDGSLEVKQMRGFASVHELVPAVVTNTKDDPRARAFTILHELGHLLAAGARNEDWCNTFAAQILMPAVPFTEAVEATPIETPADVDRLALDFGVSSLAAAVRLRRLGLNDASEGNALIAQIKARPSGKSGGGGGDYYRNKIAWLGPSYIGLVFDALEGQAVTYPAASRLLGGAKVDNLPRLQQAVHERISV